LEALPANPPTNSPPASVPELTGDALARFVELSKKSDLATLLYNLTSDGQVPNPVEPEQQASFLCRLALAREEIKTDEALKRRTLLDVAATYCPDLSGEKIREILNAVHPFYGTRRRVPIEIRDDDREDEAELALRLPRQARYCSEWYRLEDFPGYIISGLRTIMRLRNGRGTARCGDHVNARNFNGRTMVVLYDGEGKQRTRNVERLLEAARESA
jgi:hypothetical protein